MRRFALAAVLTAAATPALAQTAAPAPAPAAAATAPSAPQVADAILLDRGRKLTDWLLNAQPDSILAHMSEETRTKVGGADGIMKMSAQIAMRAGAPTRVAAETMNRRKGLQQYWREQEFDGDAPEPIVFRWVFDAKGEVVGAGINPKSAAPAPDQ
jgi:hypothetical protein